MTLSEMPFRMEEARRSCYSAGGEGTGSADSWPGRNQHRNSFFFQNYHYILQLTKIGRLKIDFSSSCQYKEPLLFIS